LIGAAQQIDPGIRQRASGRRWVKRLELAMTVLTDNLPTQEFDADLQAAAASRAFLNEARGPGHDLGTSITWPDPTRALMVRNFVQLFNQNAASKTAGRAGGFVGGVRTWDDVARPSPRAARQAGADKLD
jgi:hypothetical protein